MFFNKKIKNEKLSSKEYKNYLLQFYKYFISVNFVSIILFIIFTNKNLIAYKIILLSFWGIFIWLACMKYSQKFYVRYFTFYKTDKRFFAITISLIFYLFPFLNLTLTYVMTKYESFQEFKSSMRKYLVISLVASLAYGGVGFFISGWSYFISLQMLPSVGFISHIVDEAKIVSQSKNALKNDSLDCEKFKLHICVHNNIQSQKGLGFTSAGQVLSIAVLSLAFFKESEERKKLPKVEYLNSMFSFVEVLSFYNSSGGKNPFLISIGPQFLVPANIFEMILLQSLEEITYNKLMSLNRNKLTELLNKIESANTKDATKTDSKLQLKIEKLREDIRRLNPSFSMFNEN